MSLKGKCCRVQIFLPTRGRGLIDRKRENLTSSFACASDIGDILAFGPARRWFPYADQNLPKRHWRQIHRRPLPRLESARPTDRAKWTAEMSRSRERCTNALLQLEQGFGNAAGALVMAAAVCDGLAALFELLKPIVHLVNLCLVNNETAVGWQLMRANQR
jgi:hypothetical protein